MKDDMIQNECEDIGFTHVYSSNSKKNSMEAPSSSQQRQSNHRESALGLNDTGHNQQRKESQDVITVHDEDGNETCQNKTTEKDYKDGKSNTLIRMNADV